MEKIDPEARRSAGDQRTFIPRIFLRGFALFLGAFSLANVAGHRFLGLSDANLWWIDLRGLLPGVADALISAAGSFWVGYAWKPAMRPWRRRCTGVASAVFAFAAVMNALAFWRLTAGGAIQTSMPAPLSLWISVGLGTLCWRVWGGEAGGEISVREKGAIWGVGAAAIVWAMVFPLAQAVCFGKTDYRRRAELAVVFGAKVYANGQLSDAVADRVRTAVQLYREGWVKELVMSGGPGDGAVHETEAMRGMAMRMGVPASAVGMDPLGLNTAATVRNTSGKVSGRTALAVSEFYHLPRIKLAYASAGLEVYTVPAQPAHWLRAWPARSMLREVPAFWAYYARGIWAGVGRQPPF